ncbi:MAG: hypothetical protein M5R42_04950 [Rhodocyclaceae bacterium]|nr:hypothetical protein [Rhodocyclaceae bacterium]
MLSGLSDQLCSVFEQVPAERHKDELQKICQRFGSSIPFDGEQLQSAMKRSLDEVASYTAAVRLNLQQSALGRQVGAWIGKGTEVGPEDSPADASASIPGNLAKTVAMAAPESDESSQASAGKTEPIAPRWRMSRTYSTPAYRTSPAPLVEDFALADILRIIVETMYRGIGFQHVLLCIKDARNNGMAAKFGFGPDIEEIIRRFRFPLGGRKDIFDVALSRGADILISDIRDPEDQRPHPGMVPQGHGGGNLHPFPAGDQGHTGRADLCRQGACRRTGHPGERPLHAAGAAQPGRARHQAVKVTCGGNGTQGRSSAFGLSLPFFGWMVPSRVFRDCGWPSKSTE